MSTTSHRTTPTDLPSWAIPAEELEVMLATDDDQVDTAVIPRLAFREAVEESAAPGESLVAPAEPQSVTPEPATIEPVTPPVGHSLRQRHASPESVRAIRRNLVAVACLVVCVLLVGAAVTWAGGWIGLVGYAVLVLGAALLVRRANARYAPRHSRYTPRHA